MARGIRRILTPADFLAALDVADFEQRWRDRLADPAPEVRYVVGEDPAGEMIGFGAAGPTRDDDAPAPCELYAINLLAAGHGTGLADLLMAELVGDRASSLWVIEGNARARAFYRRHGFERDGATRENEANGVVEIRLVRT